MESVKEELKSIIHKYEGIVIRSKTFLDSELIKCSIRLKVIGRAGVGVDNIDIKSCTEKGILVMNMPDGNTISAAEHTFSLIAASLILNANFLMLS